MLPSDEPPNLDLITPIFRFRWLIALGVVAGLILGAVYEIIATARYTATVVVVPATNRTDLPQLRGGLAALSGLAGGKLGGNNVNSMDRFTFLLTSTRLAERQIARRPILLVLFPERWDARHRGWVPPTGFVQGISESLKQIFGIPTLIAPDKFAVAKTYEKNLAQAKIGDTELIRISYNDKDPARAVQVLRWIVDDANEIVRGDAAQRAQQQSAYLRERLRTSTIQDYRETLLSLLAQEEQTLMLSSSRLPFAADTIEGESTSPVPTSKRPFTTMMAGALLGLMLTYLACMIAFNFRRVVPKPTDAVENTTLLAQDC